VYAVIRKFNRMHSIDEAGRRAETGLVPILRQSPGFQGYYIIRGNNDMVVSVSLFDTRDAVQEAHRRAMDWIRENLSDFLKGEPEVITGEVIVSVPVQGTMAA
jgi:hypothetical protein